MKKTCIFETEAEGGLSSGWVCSLYSFRYSESMILISGAAFVSYICTYIHMYTYMNIYIHIYIYIRGRERQREMKREHTVFSCANLLPAHPRFSCCRVTGAESSEAQAAFAGMSECSEIINGGLTVDGEKSPLYGS